LNPKFPSLFSYELAIASFLLSFICVIAFSRVAERLSLVDEAPGGRHGSDRVPTVGGLAIYVALLTMVTMVTIDKALLWMVYSASILVFIGVMDDRQSLSITARLFFQVFSVLAAISSSGLWITSLGTGLNALDFSFVALGIPITVFAVVGVINSFNMSDGIDGLASGCFIIALLSVAFCSYLGNSSSQTSLWLILLVSISGAFWLINMNLTPISPAFLGDSGSTLLGFLIGWTLIFFSQKPQAYILPISALWCVAIPVADTLFVIIARIRRKRSPFTRDRSHLHHRMQALGLSDRTALSILLLASCLLNAGGILLVYQTSQQVGLVVFVIFLVGFTYLRMSQKIERVFAKVFGLDMPNLG
jgi:UDP-GlcNAc:undecaprenyl-phosphate GlcNAc-1-phosphate transferase